MTPDLFEFEEREQHQAWREELCVGAVVLRGFATPEETAIFAALQSVTSEAPFRHMITPGGFRMSVAMINCGTYGWVSDRTGYRYDATDPESGKPWPRMPDVFLKLARDAAASAGFEDFEVDACLVNRYEPGARLSLHQDKNERDFDAPIVSVSLGIPAVFLWGGLRREDRPVRIPLMHGDVMVWGRAVEVALSRRSAAQGRVSSFNGRLSDQSDLSQSGVGNIADALPRQRGNDGRASPFARRHAVSYSRAAISYAQ